jgi:beta-galactosidase
LQTCLIAGDKVLDKVENKVGFRYMEFHPDKGFFLNGRHRKLQGVCEHHDLGALGAAFHKSAMRRKFRILKEMGVNAIRGSHNMMAPGAMDLADEMGLLVVSEAFDMWERSKTPYDYARFFQEWSGKDVKSWICRDRNHPCVIMWSIGNEIYDTHADEHGLEVTKYLMELVRKYDPEENAGITLGSNYMPWENTRKCAELYKLAGYNYSEKYYKEHHEMYPDWVIYGSETSSIVQSRGVYHFPLKAGILAEDDEQCSALGNSATSWGAKSMEDCITVDRDMEFSMGQFLWTGFDYIGEPTPYHTKNSYFGQVDTAGFAKDSYYVWQSVWTDYHKKPMIHVFPYWDFNPGQLIDVRVCSNAPVVELFLNDRSLGRQILNHLPKSGKQVIADYRVPYEEGSLRAVGYDEEGKELVRQERTSFGDSAKVALYPENTVAAADGKEILFLQIGTVDVQGRIVENACDRVTVKVSGAGRLVGLDNGDSTDFDSYKGTSRRLFNGKLLAMIQTKTEPGEIVVKVEAPGLEGAELVYSSVPVKATGTLNESKAPVVAYMEENRDRKIVLGKRQEVPVRKILLSASGERLFTPDQKELVVEACILPENATDKELIFKAVNDMGVDSNLVTLEQKENKVLLRALGDGDFRLRCMSKSGTEKIRLISQLEFQIEGMGQAYLNPYGFISGSQYTAVKGEAGNGNERGVATARDGETVVTYGNIDFGPVGSAEITVPIFALTDDAYPIQIWEGIPGEEESCLLGEVVYQKPSIWNVYQPETWKLNKTLKGITSISFLLRQKVHIKGFSFTEREKARMKLQATEADAVYGDSFIRTPQGIEKIGNNVSLVFSHMDFKEKGAERLRICGRAPEGKNTVHVRYFNGEEEIKQIVEFARCKEWEEQEFTLQPVAGKWDVTFVFLPGSCFDFKWFQFEA